MIKNSPTNTAIKRDSEAGRPPALQSKTHDQAAVEKQIAPTQVKDPEANAIPIAARPVKTVPAQNLGTSGADAPAVASPKPTGAKSPPQPTRPARPVVVPAAGARVAPPAKRAKRRKRHWAVIFSFFFCVVGPSAAVGWYLWERAADQYASTVGFSVRTEEVSSAIELLGGITELSGSSSSDTDILYEFIQSQRLVADIDAEIDLRGMWSKPTQDPVFSYKAPGTIEDLQSHWQRMVRVSYDSGTGLINVRALAFDPEDAQAISNAIYQKSQQMINALSDIARSDSIEFARVELDRSVEQLKIARAAVTAYRNRTQIVDPSQAVGTQTALIGNLEQQLATALIDLDLLLQTTREQDPRTVQARLRVQVIEERIAEERRKLGIGDGADNQAAFADLVGEFESLHVDREFAENSYTGALAAFEAAQAEARRQSRYLAAHVLPTRAEQAKFPQRDVLLAIFTLFAFLIWGIAVLVIYALRDRR
ncbi:capsule biosynthesis protein [uncultured Tateyamaria sp.]|uniref:capsule biosynthesis protein n=1 Tax=uncultured Tateyamaria sp. TaxID=455651 RepID=UPI00261B552D|nr:capsule biosynthesis protein [uncultured Tateyamaria sp.]